MSLNHHSHVPNSQKTGGKTRKLSGATVALALAILSGSASGQTGTPRVVGSGEHHTRLGDPVPTVVLPGGTATTEKGRWSVSASVSNTAASSQSSAKGGGQVVNIDGKELTFIQIAEMDPVERREILQKLDNIDPDSSEDLKTYLKNAANQRIQKLDANIQAANQRIEEKKSIEQEANQRIQKLDANIQAANQKLEQLNAKLTGETQKGEEIKKELLEKMQTAVSRGIPLSASNKATLEKLAKEHPSDVTVAQLLRNAKFE